MRRHHKMIVCSSVLILITGLILINVYQTSVEKAEEVIAEFEADNEIRDELYMDAKQVFETLEQARNEQRGLTVEEKQLVNEFEAKYKNTTELSFTEEMIVNNLLLMGYEIIPTSGLESEQNRYEQYRGILLEYIEFD